MMDMITILNHRTSNSRNGTVSIDALAWFDQKFALIHQIDMTVWRFGGTTQLIRQKFYDRGQLTHEFIIPTIDSPCASACSRARQQPFLDDYSHMVRVFGAKGLGLNHWLWHPLFYKSFGVILVYQLLRTAEPSRSDETVWNMFRETQNSD